MEGQDYFFPQHYQIALAYVFLYSTRPKISLIISVNSLLQSGKVKSLHFNGLKDIIKMMATAFLFEGIKLQTPNEIAFEVQQ